MTIKLILLVTFLATLSLTAFSKESEQICFSTPPGDEGIPPNSADQVRLVKIQVSDQGDVGYVATEYIGAANLQASIYLMQKGKYCLAGALGPLTDFHLDKSKKSNNHYELVVDSKSGQTKFTRGFKFQKYQYILSWCKAAEFGPKTRSCTKNEMPVGP